MAGTDDEKPGKPWVVRDVPERTRRLVKTWAAKYDVTIAQMLEFLVDAGVRGLSSTDAHSLGLRIHYAARYLRDSGTGGLVQTNQKTFQLLARLAEMEQQQQAGLPVEGAPDLYLPMLVRLGLLPSSFSDKATDADLLGGG